MQTESIKQDFYSKIEQTYQCSIQIEKDDHWKFKTSPKEYLEDFGILEEDEIPEEVIKTMVESDKIYRVEVQPKDLGIVIEAYHYDRDSALEIAYYKLLDTMQEAFK